MVARDVAVLDAFDVPRAARMPRPDEAPALHAMMRRALGGTPYAAVAAGWLDDALAARGTELRALVVEGPDSAPAGLALFGLTAGAEGAGRVHLVLASPSPSPSGTQKLAAAAVTAELLHAVMAALATLGARFALAELPGDAPFAPMRAALQAHGFAHEGQVADFYRDGVPLVLLRRDIIVSSTR